MLYLVAKFQLVRTEHGDVVIYSQNTGSLDLVVWIESELGNGILGVWDYVESIRI